MTQQALARRAKVSPRTVCSVENGTTYPVMSTRRKLLRALQIEFSPGAWKALFPRDFVPPRMRDDDAG